MHDELFDRLEHDHAPMSAVLLEIRRWFASPHGDLAALREKLELMKGLVIEHFGEEEETVFPLRSEIVPAQAANLGGLAAAHDAICGLAVRLGAGAERSEPDMTVMRTLFERLESSYAEHAKREQALLRTIRAGLTPDALEKLRARLRAR
jgi:hypothetical protein